MFRRIAEEEVNFKKECSDNLKDFIMRLLEKDVRIICLSQPNKRLGKGINDADELKSHPLYNNFNWTDLWSKRTPPPFQPFVSGRTEDVTNFDDEFTNQIPAIPDSNYEGSYYLHYQDFSYTQKAKEH